MTWIFTTIFCLSIGLFLYVLAGYPLFLGWLASRRAQAVLRDEEPRRVSFVIAVRNGEQFIAEKLNSILSVNYSRELMEIIVVSDGSEDRTEEIARGFAQEGVQLFRIPRGGKARALNLGISKATNEILILTDVRQRLDPESVRQVISCFADPKIGAVSGEVCILRGETRDEADTRLYWNYEVWIRKRMSQIDSTFGCNGPFYALRRSLAVTIPPETLLDDVYLPLAAFFAGYRLILDDSAQVYDYPTSLHSEFGRKIRTQAGLYQTLRLCPQLLTSKNRMRFHFLSGKFGRLALPYLVVLAGVSSFGLPWPWNICAVASQAFFYMVAVADLAVSPSTPLKRLTSPIRTFVVLMISSLLGLRVFFVKPGDLWKETRVRKVNV